MFARGVAQRPIFRDPLDRRRHLSLLARVIAKHGWLCLSYCQMVNHVHLLVETPIPNLGRGMQRLHGAYGAAFNKRHGTAGHVFDRVYGSRRVTDDAYLWTVAAYIARNPIEDDLCERPEEWTWSSYRAVVADAAPEWLARSRLLELFSGAGGDPLARYVAHCSTPTKPSHNDARLPGGSLGSGRRPGGKG